MEGQSGDPEGEFGEGVRVLRGGEEREVGGVGGGGRREKVHFCDSLSLSVLTD